MLARAVGVPGDDAGVDGVLSSRSGVEATLAAGVMLRAGSGDVHAPLSTSVVPSSMMYVTVNEVGAVVVECSSSQFQGLLSSKTTSRVTWSLSVAGSYTR
jgi:hypothetical protein